MYMNVHVQECKVHDIHVQMYIYIEMYVCRAIYCPTVCIPLTHSYTLYIYACSLVPRLSPLRAYFDLIVDLMRYMCGVHALHTTKYMWSMRLGEAGDVAVIRVHCRLGM